MARIYVLESIREPGASYVEVSYRCMHEMTPAQLSKAQETARPEQKFGRISKDFAHSWVRRGELHTTPLWFDGERVRRSS